MKKVFSKIFMLSVGALAFTACADEYNPGAVTKEDLLKENYAKHWEDVFGTPDPNQDWSMAALTVAGVNLPEIQGTSKLNIMTGNPTDSSTRLLAQVYLEDGKAAPFAFDAIKGTEKVFVTVEQNNKYMIYGQYSIKNGLLSIGDYQFPMTRAFSGANACPTTQSGSAINGPVNYKKYDGQKIKFNTEVKTLDEWIAATKAAVNWQTGTTSFPFTDESVRHFFQVTGIDFANSSLVLKSSAESATKNLITYNGSSKTPEEWQVVVNGQYGAIVHNYWSYENQSPWEETGLVQNGADNAFDFENSTLVLKSTAKQGDVDLITYSGQTKSIDEWKTDASNNLNPIFVWNTWNGPWENSSFEAAGVDCAAGASGIVIYKGIYPETDWVLRDEAEEIPTYVDTPIKLQYLSNVETNPADPWNISLGYSLFGDDAFFAESVAYNDSRKLGVYYTESEMANMEKGFSIITTGTEPIELPYIFGVTDYSNIFGYIYYKVKDENGDDIPEDQLPDPLSLKHFVLMEDARPSSNIYHGAGGYTWNIEGRDLNGKPVGPKELGTWSEYKGTFGEYTKYKPDQIGNQQIVGTSYRVMFFGEDGSATTGNYIFPAGYRIIFFIDDLGSAANLENHTGFKPGNFNYSIPELNEKIGHNYQFASTYPEKKDMGMVKSIVWSRDGNTYMGFGDNSGDQDLNDVVFLVRGGFTPDEPIIKVAPIYWHMNLNAVHQDDDIYVQQSLNVGATYSQPSNNPAASPRTFLGWATSPTGTPGSISNKTVLNESAVHYYAIWDTTPTPTPDPEPISWIFACEDLGGTFDYDFNDVVWEAKKVNDHKLEVKVLAAGGTLPFTLKYNGTSICTKTTAFNETVENSDVINANAGKTATPKIFTIEITEDWTISSNYTKFTVEVENHGATSHISAYSKEETAESKAPQVILLPSEWEWPTEGTNISAAYTNFTTWVTDGAAAPWSEWLSHKTGNTVSRQ